MINAVVKYCFWVFLGFLIFSSCSLTKKLADDELLVTSTSVEFEEPDDIVNKYKLTTQLLEIAKPELRYGLGGFNLWLYQAMGEPKKEKSLRSWIKRKLGTPPELFDDRTIERSRLILTKRMQDLGYFGTTVKVDTLVKKQKVDLTYRIENSGRYRVRNIEYPDDTLNIVRYMTPLEEKPILKPDAYYSKFDLDKERARLEGGIQKKGYLDFRGNAIFYYVDTALGNQQVDVFMKVKPFKDSLDYERYYLGNTYVYPNYSLEKQSEDDKKDTISYKNINVIQSWEILKPDVLQQNIIQRTGDVINQGQQQTSVSHLLDLDVFKFVNLKYQPRYENNRKYLDRFFLLTPALNQRVSGEFQINNRVGGYLGTTVIGTYTHRNLFKRGEHFQISLSGGVETQLGDQDAGTFINTLDFTAEASLRLPTFLIPFLEKRTWKRFVPQTFLSLNANFQIRTELFTQNALRASFGYDWKENQRVHHVLNLLRVNRVRLINREPKFDTILMNDPRLANSFKDVFISGLEYTYTFNNQSLDRLEPYFVIRTQIGTSGNVLGLLSGKRGTEPNEIIGVPYAQFFKISPDIRFYLPRRKNLLAARLNLGLGIPYGNSEELPYITQFFVGGANSIRAFRLRALGPGSFFDTTAVRDQFIDQTGDIKMEFSTEYRFDLLSYLKGAIFVDAGNIWVLNSETRPQGVFNFSDFHESIAIGTGLGLRLDFDFFVIRLDGSFALRQPTPDQTFEWTFNKINFLDGHWRSENLILNLAIGYPF